MSPLDFKNSITAPSPLFAKHDSSPNPESTVQGDKYRFTVLSEGCIRYEYSPDGSFEDRASTFAVHRNLAKPQYTLLKHDDGGLEIKTDRLHLQYDGKEFTASGLYCDCRAKIGQEWMQTWRFGFTPNTLGGTCRTLDGADGRVELEGGVLSPNSICIIDDSNSMLFTPDGWVGTRVDGRVDGYIFGYGGDYREALRVYYDISGKPPLLPRWALGNWWSRYYPYSADSYLELMDRFKQQKIPMSVAVLDMDWHKVDIPEEYGTPWTGYTWEKKLFPDHVGFMQQLHDRQLKITTNTHPADGVRGFEDAYPEMCKVLGKDAKEKHPVNFDCTSRTFMSAYMSTLHHPLEDEGIDFWWLDWQQGTHSRVPGIDPLWILNHYHFIDSTRRMGRPMTFSRYAGPGSGRYPIGFSGDTHVTWDTIHFQPEFTATAANIGFGWWSHDIGGHWGGNKDDELATRWVQLGCFSPILRLHSSNNPFNSREPWKYGLEAERIQTQFLQLRHRLVPYIYTEAVKCAVEGRSLVEPIYYDYSDRPEAYKNKNQSTFGTQVIVSPITTPRDSGTNLGRADTFLPPGIWVDLFTHLVYDGDRIVALHRPLDQVPVLAKPGAIIPLDGSKEVKNGCRLPEEMEVIVILGADGEYEILEDNGEGTMAEEVKFSRTEITYDQTKGEITIHPSSNPLLSSRVWLIRLPAYVTKDTITATSTSGPIDVQVTVNTLSDRTKIVLPLLPTSERITINLPSNPQLTPNHTLPRIERLLDSMQTDINVKLDIWNAVKAEGKPHVRISRLEALNLDQEVGSAVKEILFAQE